MKCCKLLECIHLINSSVPCTASGGNQTGPAEAVGIQEYLPGPLDHHQSHCITVAMATFGGIQNVSDSCFGASPNAGEQCDVEDKNDNKQNSYLAPI